MLCPACGKSIVETAWVCPYCKVELKKPAAGTYVPPAPAPVPSRRKLVREIWIFLVGSGALLIFIVWMIARMDPPGHQARERATAIGYTVVGVGALMVLAGGLFAATRINAFAYVGAGVAIVLFLAMFIVQVLINGAQGNLCPLVIPGLATVLIGHRISLLPKARD